MMQLHTFLNTSRVRLCCFEIHSHQSIANILEVSLIQSTDMAMLCLDNGSWNVHAPFCLGGKHRILRVATRGELMIPEPLSANTIFTLGYAVWGSLSDEPGKVDAVTGPG